ncbi:MAG: TrkH family potassium uptake protein, partial [Kiritimatiellae bacterium]|nr:TrkH family potassium uptake protein [Kiritimatiellia bacterium]
AAVPAALRRRREASSPQESQKRTMEPRTAFAAVGASWVAAGLFGAVPLALSGAFASVIDAVFESVSGFTTTGATVLSDVESLPRAVNFWRCETHWLGGMGVVVLVVALVPLLGMGGFRLVKAETTGPEKGKFTARIADTAKSLWLAYGALTALQAVLLRLCGLGWFDSVCHAFSTLGTGGFSTRNASVAAFGSPAAEWVCTVFMLLASVNFALYCRFIATRKLRVFADDSELRAFVLVVLCAAGLCSAALAAGGTGVAAAVRLGAFQTASIVSTTGFMTADYVLWPGAAQVVLLALFFVGGCSGSTAGGVKVVRWTLLAKQAAKESSRLLHPRLVSTVRMDGRPGRDALVPVAAAFVFAYLALVGATAFAGALAGLGPFEALTGALSAVGNVGPAFGRLGPTSNYAFLPAPLKAWYCFAMLAGRLEIHAMAILAFRVFGALVPRRRARTGAV